MVRYDWVNGKFVKCKNGKYSKSTKRMLVMNNRARNARYNLKLKLGPEYGSYDVQPWYNTTTEYCVYSKTIEGKTKIFSRDMLGMALRMAKSRPELAEFTEQEYKDAIAVHTIKSVNYDTGYTKPEHVKEIIDDLRSSKAIANTFNMMNIFHD